MPMVSLKLMAGAARSMVVASARTTAAEITVRACGGVQGRSGGRTASWGPGRGSYPIVFGWISETTRNVAISRKGKPPKESRYFSRARMRNRHNGLDGKKYPFNCMIALRGH
jgi:hypothetical protein